MVPDASFLFIRHGETGWNRERRIQGQTDAPLNETGIEQAEQAAELLSAARIGKIIASPLSRALDTAKAIAARHELEPELDPDLRECSFGAYEGRLFDDVVREEGYDAGAGIWDLRPKDGERFEPFTARCIGAVARGLADAEGAPVLFVAHGGVFRALTRTLCRKDLALRNAEAMEFVSESSIWRVAPFGAR